MNKCVCTSAYHMWSDVCNYTQLDQCSSDHMKPYNPLHGVTQRPGRSRLGHLNREQWLSVRSIFRAAACVCADLAFGDNNRFLFMSSWA